jgi:ArsR family transcriptional regulator, lead/cadmium/zinc/bismuth-responsive transcriptional repressor
MSISPSAPPLSCDVYHADPARIAAIRASAPGDDAIASLSEIFRALGDPTRLRLLSALGGGELCVCDLASLAGISESATSHQLRLLRALRLVRARRDGRMVFYRLDDEHVAGLVAQGLQHVGEGRVRGEG